MPDNEVVITPARGIEQTWRSRLVSTWPVLVAWTMRDLRARYRQSLLRSGWSLAQPLAILLTYGWVLTAVLDVRPEEAPFLTFAWAGIVPFTFVSQSLSLGVGSIQQAGPVISRVYLPKEVLPLSVVGASLTDLAVMTATLFVVAGVQVGSPGVHALGILAADVVLILWTVVLTVGSSAATVFRRDLNFAVPLLLRIWFIVTPVMYEARLLEERSHWLVDLNPVAVVIEATRSATYGHRWPDWTLLGIHAAVATAALCVVMAGFRRLEPRMSDVA